MSLCISVEKCHYSLDQLGTTGHRECKMLLQTGEYLRAIILVPKISSRLSKFAQGRRAFIRNENWLQILRMEPLLVGTSLGWSGWLGVIANAQECVDGSLFVRVWTSGNYK